MESVVNAVDLFYSYKTDGGETSVLRNINLEIKKGEFTAILGRNGSGKSTLAKHLNAILLPSGGKVYIGKMDSSDEDNTLNIRKYAGMVFQNPDNQLVTTVVEDDVAFAPENLCIERSEIRKRVDGALAAVGMSGYKKRTVTSLSGGEKQKTAIAGVLAMEPEIIILDESTAMLDPIGRKDILTTVKRLNREKNITVILITHYMEEAVGADRVIVMSDGEIILNGTPKEVFQNAGRIKSLGLDVPQVTELACELRKRGLDIPQDILTVDECEKAIKKLIGGSDHDKN